MISRRALLLGFIAATLAQIGPAMAQQLLASDPLLVAAFNGDAQLVRRILLGGKSPNVSDNDNRTALMWAVIAGRNAAVAELLSFKPRLELADLLGNTALYYAADRGDPDLVDQLLAAGAPVNAENRQGATPLIAAARAGHELVLRRLLAAKADRNQTDYTGKTALDWAREGRSSGVTRLLEAVR